MGRIKKPRALIRVPMMTSLPIFLDGVCMPCPDLNDTHTLLAGVEHRMDRPIPARPGTFLRSLRKSTLTYIRERNIRPIPADSDRSVEAWLERTSYNQARKTQLLAIRDKIINPFEEKSSNVDGDRSYDIFGCPRNIRKKMFKNFIVKLFAKEETYEGYKQARGIYARDDVAKVFFGPYFKLMEDELYKQPEFIKHVPVHLRPEYILEHLSRHSAQYLTTDYTSFECHFTEDVMENCEFILYAHMLSSIPEGPFVMSIIRRVMAGINRIYCSGFKAEISARRMSGEMCTSLGNGFSNLMFMKTYCDFTNQELCGVVEGDDGIFRFVGNQNFDLFKEWGLILKMQLHPSMTTASFCGMIFDEDAKQSIGNPFKILARLGWSTRRYVRSNQRKLSILQTAKALSALYEHPACPIVAEFCRMILRSHACSRYSLRKFAYTSSFSEYERTKLLKAIDTPDLNLTIDRKTRLLFEELYGIPVGVQLFIENELQNQSIDGLERLIDSGAFPRYQSYHWDWFTSPKETNEMVLQSGTLPQM